MANTFKNATVAVTASPATVYTAPASAGDVAIVLQLQAANVGSGTHPVTATLTRVSGTPTITHLAKNVSVPLNAAIGLIAGKLVLEAGDSVQVNSDAVSQIEINLSALEIT
jgi:hypothetical protein